MTPRIRMFAGPNGSGKSTLKQILPQGLLGIYLNPDDIEADIRFKGFLDFNSYGVKTSQTEMTSFLTDSSLLKSANLGDIWQGLQLQEGRLNFGHITVNSYIASVLVDFLRQKLLEDKVSFTFETVMSHPSKVSLLTNGQREGFRTYLYFIATRDPLINVSRVNWRVQQGGHPVPEDKIIERYYRSLDLLMEAIQYTNRSYIFDNSDDKGNHPTCIAEITEGREMVVKTDQVPIWFKKAVLDKISS